MSLVDRDLKLCAQGEQNETNGNSNYDVMTTDSYLSLIVMGSTTTSPASDPQIIATCRTMVAFRHSVFKDFSQSMKC